MYLFMNEIEWSSDEQYIYVLGEDLIAKLKAEDGSIENFSTYDISVPFYLLN